MDLNAPSPRKWTVGLDPSDYSIIEPDNEFYKIKKNYLKYKINKS